MRRNLIRITVPLAVVATAFAAQGFFSAAQAAEPPRDLALTIQSVPNGLMVDLAGSNTSQGAAINEWSYNNATNQQWWLQRVGDHWKVKSNINGAWCLTRAADGNLAKIVLGGCDNYRADWDFQDLGGEKWRIKDPAGNYYLHVWNETPTQGRELVTSGNDQIGSYWFLTGLDVKRRSMPSDPRLDQTTFLTTHNAMANTDEGFWGRVPNQSYSLRSQLDQGVRAMQLDVHSYGGGVRMCHNSCWGNERTFTAGLTDVVNWLNSHPYDVVTLFLEDYTSVAELQSAVNATSGVGNLLFRPDQWNVRGTGWPTLTQMRAYNKRLLIFSQRSGRDSFGVYWDHDWTVENYWSLGGSGTNQNCYSRWGDVPLSKEESGWTRLHVMNHYRDIPSEGNASADNGGKLATRVNRYCGPAARHKPNYVAVDFFQKTDGASTGALVSEMNTYW